MIDELSGVVSGVTLVQATLTKIAGVASRVAHMSAEVVITIPAGQSLLAHLGMELVTSKQRSELVARTVPFDERLLAAST